MKKLLFLVAMSTIFLSSCQKEFITPEDSNLKVKTGQFSITFIDGSVMDFPAHYYVGISLVKGQFRFKPNEDCLMSVQFCNVAGLNNVKNYREKSFNWVTCK